jgi:hypothetical protein
MITAVLSQLSVRDALRFQGANRRAQHLVTGMRSYKAVTTHASECLTAVFRMNISDTVRFADIYYTMCMPLCEMCASSGSCMYLPTLTRCCL